MTIFGSPDTYLWSYVTQIQPGGTHILVIFTRQTFRLIHMITGYEILLKLYQ